MKKISHLLAVAFIAITLTACSAGPKTTTSSVPNSAPVVAQTNPTVPPPALPSNPVAQTNPTVPPPALPSNPVAQTVSDPTPVTPPAIAPAPVKAPVKPLIAPTPALKLITIQSFSFRPANLMISKGDTVKWTNKDSAPHLVTSDSFKSETLKMSDSFSFTFSEAGTFAYSCQIHPNMRGTIIVK